VHCLNRQRADEHNRFCLSGTWVESGRLFTYTKPEKSLPNLNFALTPTHFSSFYCIFVILIPEKGAFAVSFGVYER
jgi:hypothetical protein